MSANVAWALRILDALARAGVQHVAVCPGSRSAPLALAARAHPDLGDRVVLDERCAGFWAVGVAKATGAPAAVITTSGTAVANLLPAAVEASNAAVPLVLLTADRPEELRDRGSNQTIHQPGLFGAFVRREADLAHPTDEPAALAALEREVATCMEAALGRCPGPVHLNQPLREPLAPDDADQHALAEVPRVQRTPPARAAVPVDARTLPRLHGRGVVVAGPGPVAPDDAERIHAAAKRLDAPVLADALSGLRTGDALHHADAWIEAVDARPDWVVQVGAAPTSKTVGRWLLGLDGGPSLRLRVDETGRRWDEGSPTWVDGHPAEVLEALADHADTAADARWSAADRAAADTLDATGTEAAAVLAAARAADRTLFVGNSLAVRDLDRYAGAVGRVLGNRGASGIDGTVATLAGIAQATGPAVGVVGELAFQHDLGGLALLRDAPARLVVVQNGGGGIFRHLPISTRTPHFGELFLTPQALDVGAVCAAFGLSHARVPVDDVDAALEGDARVVEAVVDGDAAARRRTEVGRAAAEAAARAWRHP